MAWPSAHGPTAVSRWKSQEYGVGWLPTSIFAIFQMVEWDLSTGRYRSYSFDNHTSLPLPFFLDDRGLSPRRRRPASGSSCWTTRVTKELGFNSHKTISPAKNLALSPLKRLGTQGHDYYAKKGGNQLSSMYAWPVWIVPEIWPYAVRQLVITLPKWTIIAAHEYMRMAFRFEYTDSMPTYVFKYTNRYTRKTRRDFNSRFSYLKEMTHKLGGKILLAGE